MALIIMILAPFPLGYFLRNRLAAFVAFIAVHSFVFTFQSLSLVIEWAGGSQEAFGPYPQASDGNVLSYAAVNLVIYLVGFGLVMLGHRLGSKRRASKNGPVHLDAAVK
jgi:hypothetical protein